MVCLDLNPGPQDGRRRQNQGAMVATQEKVFLKSRPSASKHLSLEIPLRSIFYLKALPTSVNYDSRLIITSKLLIFTTLET